MKEKIGFAFKIFITKYLSRKTDAKDYLGMKIRHRKKIKPEFREVIKKVRSECLEVQRELDEADERGEEFRSLWIRMKRPYKSLGNALAVPLKPQKVKLRPTFIQ